MAALWGIRSGGTDSDLASSSFPAPDIQDFVNFSSELTSPKLKFKGFVESDYAHGLTEVPFFFLFSVDSVTAPTYFEITSPTADNTYIYVSGPSYLVVFENE